MKLKRVFEEEGYNDEIVIEIMMYLNGRELMIMKNVNRKLYNLLKGNELWNLKSQQYNLMPVINLKHKNLVKELNSKVNNVINSNSFKLMSSEEFDNFKLKHMKYDEELFNRNKTQKMVINHSIIEDTTSIIFPQNYEIEIAKNDMDKLIDFYVLPQFSPTDDGIYELIVKHSSTIEKRLIKAVTQPKNTPTTLLRYSKHIDLISNDDVIRIVDLKSSSLSISEMLPILHHPRNGLKNLNINSVQENVSLTPPPSQFEESTLLKYRILTVLNNGTMALMSMFNGQIVQSFTKEHTLPIYSVALNSVQNELASVGVDTKVVLWDVEKGVPKANLSSRAKGYQTKYAEDGFLWVLNKKDDIVGYDTRMKKECIRLKDGSNTVPDFMAFDLSGPVIGTIGINGDSAKYFDIRFSHQCLRSIVTPPVQNTITKSIHVDDLNSCVVCFHPNMDRLYCFMVNHHSFEMKPIKTFHIPHFGISKFFGSHLYHILEDDHSYRLSRYPLYPPSNLL